MAELASTAVDGIRASALYKSGNAAMKRYLGEALTLRSLSYFELVSVGEIFLLRKVCLTAILPIYGKEF